MNHFLDASPDVCWPLMWLNTCFHHCVIKPEMALLQKTWDPLCCTQKWLTPATVIEYVPIWPSNCLIKRQIIFLKPRCLSQCSLVVMSLGFEIKLTWIQALILLLSSVGRAAALLSSWNTFRLEPRWMAPPGEVQCRATYLDLSGNALMELYKVAAQALGKLLNLWVSASKCVKLGSDNNTSLLLCQL